MSILSPQSATWPIFKLHEKFVFRFSPFLLNCSWCVFALSRRYVRHAYCTFHPSIYLHQTTWRTSHRETRQKTDGNLLRRWQTYSDVFELHCLGTASPSRPHPALLRYYLRAYIVCSRDKIHNNACSSKHNETHAGSVDESDQHCEVDLYTTQHAVSTTRPCSTSCQSLRLPVLSASR